MKKHRILIGPILWALALAGCSNSPASSSTASQLSESVSETSSTGSSQTNESALQETADQANASSSDRHVLVAYFTYGENAGFEEGIDTSSSASIQIDNGQVTGNTGLLAHWIANRTGADQFSIQTVDQYPQDYDAVVEIGQEEKNNGTLPAIANHIENLDQYDTIFIGFPNWWYGMPRVMNTFFDEYDFAGKTIIPFGTSGGSGFSDAVSEIKTLEPEAQVVDNGLQIGGLEAANAQEQVEEWASSFNLNQTN